MIGLGSLGYSGEPSPSTGNAIPGTMPKVIGFGTSDSIGVKSTSVFANVARVSAAPAPSSANGCGDEPGRKQVGAASVPLDPKASAAWLACMQRNSDAYAHAQQVAIDAAADCGTEPPLYDKNADPSTHAYWLACRAKRAPATPAPTASTTSPQIVPGAPVVVPQSLVSTPSGSGGGGSIDPGSAAAVNATAAPAAVAATFGGHVEVPDAAWIGGGIAVLVGLAWMLHKKGVL